MAAHIRTLEIIFNHSDRRISSLKKSCPLSVFGEGDTAFQNSIGDRRFAFNNWYTVCQEINRTHKENCNSGGNVERGFCFAQSSFLSRRGVDPSGVKSKVTMKVFGQGQLYHNAQMAHNFDPILI
jgi:hypothetical protein